MLQKTTGVYLLKISCCVLSVFMGIQEQLNCYSELLLKTLCMGIFGLFSVLL